MRRACLATQLLVIYINCLIRIKKEYNSTPSFPGNMPHITKLKPKTTAQDSPGEGHAALSPTTTTTATTDDHSTADEFTRLVKFVSAYRESDSTSPDEEGEVRVSRVWYAPWRKRRFRWKHTGDGARKFPDDWLLTDIRQGLGEADVVNRRNVAGFNELAAAKENPFAKVISYFQGPILYGEINIFSFLAFSVLMML